MYYDESCQRRELSLKNRETRARLADGSPVALSAVAIGIMVLGAFPMLIGLKVVEVEPQTLHVPHWVMFPVGLSFFLAGLMLFERLINRYVMERRTRQFDGDTLRGQALADYPWNEPGYRPSRWQRLLRNSFGAGFLSIFLVAFNYWAFFAVVPFNDRIIVATGVLAFDGVLLYGWWLVLLRFGRVLKYGDSRIEFLDFPYQSSETVVLRWVPPNGLRRGRNASFTLRCVEEIWETVGTKNNERTTVKQEEVWSGSWRFGPEEELPPRQVIDLSFKIPEDSPSTVLADESPTFWELGVKIEDKGFDFEETYLVPIYST